MIRLFLITLGGALGSICRYGVSIGVYFLIGRNFPYGTLVVNITGCFLMGLLFTLFLERYNEIADHLRALLLIGFLGGYTTFSAFSIETLSLFENGEAWAAISNIILSVGLCMLAVWMGTLIGRNV